MIARLKAFRFETGRVKKTEQSTYFRDIIGSYYNIHIDESREQGFKSDESVWLIGDRTVFSAQQQPYFKSRPAFPSDRAPERVSISFCTTARGHSISGESSASWNPGDVVIDFTNRPMVWQSLTDTHETSIVLPCRDVGFDPFEHPALTVYPGRSGVARSIRMHASLIVEALQSGDHDPVPMLLDGFSLMVGTLFSDSQPDPSHEGVRALKRRAILKYIEQNLLCPNLSVNALCTEFGMSRPALYRLFEDYGGVADHIRNRKLDKAYSKIIGLPDSQSNISAIASELGFYDHAHLSHRFKERFGLAPRELLSIYEEKLGDFSRLETNSPLQKDGPDFIDLVTGGRV